ncbi:MAG TPA: hypothetical protein PKG81_06255, partial [Candidatus Omnitrophota bacterium]|nr:hypothetical protein [Candidatus Omnitrophota bacterium]
SNARDHGYEHLAIKARVEHIPIIMAAENCGFRTVSATTTYLYIKNITKPPKWKYLFKIRTAVPTDKSALMRIASESFSHTRYYNDPFFSKDKCGMLYRKWVENCFDKDWSSNVLVATNSNKDPVGFITYKVDPELENATGVRRGGTGLSACLPHAKGAYLALMAHLMNDVPAKEIPFGEYTTQLENIEVIRAWQHFGLEPGKNEIALHLTL